MDRIRYFIHETHVYVRQSQPLRLATSNNVAILRGPWEAMCSVCVTVPLVIAQPHDSEYEAANLSLPQGLPSHDLYHLWSRVFCVRVPIYLCVCTHPQVCVMLKCRDDFSRCHTESY